MTSAGGARSAMVLPGATIGILGGGQLGRMTAMAARTMGYDVHVLDPDPACSAAPLASRVVTAPFADADAAADLARHCSVVTLEIEQIPTASMDAADRFAPVRPGAAALHVIQDRLRQKDWLSENGFPVGAYRPAETLDAVSDAAGVLGASIVKSCRGGYDGRGQADVESVADAEPAWAAVGARRTIVEQRLDIALECSVLVARRPSGEIAVYPPALNHHTRGVLTWSVLPAQLPKGVAREAAELAIGIAEALGIVGLLAVELFMLHDGRLLVNELAPRPHNSYHASERACMTSQFEQLVRAVCDLPLGRPTLVSAGAIANLLGDVWLGAEPPSAADCLAVDSARLHLYGKRDARPGRKMGHVSAVGQTPDEALDRVLDAYARFTHAALPSEDTSVDAEIAR